MIGFDLDVRDLASPLVRTMAQGLRDRSRLHASVAVEGENLTRDYLIGIAPRRHATADRLGATPTGHLERAAESVTSTSNAQGATVSVTSPGLSRAFGDLLIKPKKGKYLTIPATAEAYGRRARSFNDLRVAVFGKGKLALIKAEQSSVATRKESGGRSEVYYWLKTSVTLPQDRSLLPSDALYLEAVQLGAETYFEMLADAMA